MPNARSAINIKTRNYTIVLSIFLLISIILTQSILLYFVKNGQVLSIESAVRENIMLDNRREVVALLNQASNFGFDRVEMQKTGYHNNIAIGRKADWWKIRLKRNLFFDKSRNFPASTLAFYYSPFEGAGLLLLIWVSISLIAILPIRSYVRKQDRIQTQEEESRRNKAVLEVINTLAHDMRAPLGIFERLLSVPGEPSPTMRSSIKDALSRLHFMIESLRYSEAENLVKKSLSKINFSFGYDSLLSKAMKYKVKLSFSNHDNLEAVQIDAIKIERAWMNLASNAIEAAKSSVRVQAKKQESDLIIRVIDDGPGVPNEILPNLFQRGITYGKSDGTGLGLAYVRQVMQGHDGDVHYYRENGQTVFECRIPHAFETNGPIHSDLPTEIPFEEKVQKVALCLLPKTVAADVHANLTSRKSRNFLFACEFSADTDIVVTNEDEILFRAMDEEKEVIQLRAGLTSVQILERLTRKFSLQPG